MSYLKSDQQRIKELLSETIVLLCKNGLHFETEFSIEALIAITLDKKDIFLVSINETVLTERMFEDINIESSKLLASVSLTAATSQTTNSRRSDLIISQTTGKKRRHSDERNLSNGFPVYIDALYTETSKLQNPESHSEMETYSSFSKEIKESKEQDTNVEGEENVNDVKTFDLQPDNDSVKLQNVQTRFAFTSDNQVIQCKGSAAIAVKRERLSDDIQTLKLPPSAASVNRNQHLRQHSGHHKVNLTLLDDSFADALQSHSSSWISCRRNCLELDVPLEFDLQHTTGHPTFPAILRTNPTDFNFDHMSCNVQPHPNLSPDELSTASLILTIPGAFINLGCVKAIRQKLRKVPKETLVMTLEMMSVICDSPFFVGILRCEGISRTFYKCPPSAIKQEALDYYQLDYNIYTDLYNGSIKVPNNIKDPEDWITKTKTMSPFIEHQL